MGFNEEYTKLRKKRLEEEEQAVDNKSTTAYKRLLSSPSKASTAIKVEGDSGLIKDKTEDKTEDKSLTNAVLELLYKGKGIGDKLSSGVEETTEKTSDKAPSWFTSGAFADGYQFGDVFKTIVGTSNDIVEEANKAVFDATENLVDTVAYGVGAIGGIFDKGFQDGVGEFIARDYSGEWAEKTNNSLLSPHGQVARVILNGNTDDYSILGEKSDGVVQSGAHLVGSYALSKFVPVWLTQGVNAFGSEVEQAYQNDATHMEAGVSAGVSAVAEVATEKLFGTFKFQGKGVLDGIKEGITKNIGNKIAKGITGVMVDAAGEGVEEIVSGYLSAIGQKLTYADDKEISEIFSSEDAFDSFLGGAILGAVGGGVNAGKNIKNGRDPITGFTDSEQKVIDAEYESRLEEAEKDGTKLTKTEQNALRDKVISDMQKGYISTDIIEKVLGDEHYKAYKDAVANEEALQKEYDELYNMKNGDKSNAQIDREAELKAKLFEITSSDQILNLKNSLDGRMSDMIKDSMLAESYNEKTRRGQAFEADLTQYEPKQAAIVQKAIDSGILNNTNRTHEFVDMVSKISADKGVLFDFTNNEKLKESGFALDGRVINGFVTKGGVTLNINSAKSLNSVVGHEITHILEGTDFYDELSTAITDYAISKGDYRARYEALSKLYKDISDAEVNSELVADLVGDYLFTDQDFVNKLSVEHRNVFQKIWDEIKYLYKVATVGSKEARELEKVKKVFEQAYKQSGKAKGDTKYSLTMVEAVKPTSDKWSQSATTDEVRAKHPTLYAVDETATEKRNPTQVKGTVGSYRNIYESLKAEGFNGTILDASSGLGLGTKVGIEEYGFKVDDIEPYPDSSYKPKYTDYSALDKTYDVVISNAVLNVLPQDQRDALVAKMGESLNPGGRMFVNVRGKDVLNASGKIAINEANMEYFIPRTEKTGSYQKGFTKAELKAYLEDALGDGYTVKPTNILNGVSVIVTKDGGVKYSLSDSDGKKLTKEQSEYFKDSKMRDDNGNLKVMYHGSQNAGFHVFDPAHSDDGISLFFVDRNDVATSYSGTSETYEAQTIRNAEDMNNFIESIGAEGYEVVEKDGKFTLLYEGDRVADSKTAKGIYEEFCWYEGVGEGDANYKVYLNLTNPLVVDAEGRNWNAVTREYSQELADRYNSLTAEERAALTNLASWEEISIFRDEIRQALADTETGAKGSYDETFAWNVRRAYEKLGGNSVNMYDLFTIASDNFSEESIKQFAVNEMKTRDYAAKAKAEGYDGVIFKNIVDVGGYGNGSEGASTVAIAFDSNQVKSVANEKPTRDPDIRFSLSEAVEETNELMAIHNLQSSELPKALSLGGMPMPSIAVIKAQQSHESYGDVSLIFPKDAIDPAKSKSNKIYGGDAWTPTYPSIEYKANEKAQKAIEKKIDNLVPYEVQRGLGRVSLDYDNLSNDLNRHNGDMYQAYRHNLAMQYAFLVDTGASVQLPMTEADLDGSGRFNNSVIIDAVRKLGASEVERLANESISGNDALISELMDLANESTMAKYAGNSKVLEMLSKKPLYTQENFGFAQADSIIRAAYRYVQSGVEQTVDYKNARDVIKEAIDEDAYKKWVEELFDGIVEKEGIRNNADFFTPSGNRRSWEALHWENTLENVLKVMKLQEQTGAGFFGSTSIYGVANKDYRSIAEVKADSDRLRTIPEEEYDAMKDSFSDRLAEIADSIKNPNERNRFIALDNAVEEIVDAVRTSKTKDGILRNMQKWNKRVTPEIVDDIVSLVNDISNMPTGYFEAKPQRAVGFDEVGVFVIPYNADSKLKQELLNRGYAIAEYNPDVEGDRQKVVNSFEEYKFSLSAEGSTPKRYGTYNVYGKDIGLAPTQSVESVQKSVQNTPENMQNVAPVTEAVAPTVDKAVDETYPEDFAPMEHSSMYDTEAERLQDEINSYAEEYKRLVAEGDEDGVANIRQKVMGLWEQIDEARNKANELKAQEKANTEGYLNSLTDADAPPEMEAPYNMPRGNITLDGKTVNKVTKQVKDMLGLDAEDSAAMAQTIQRYAQGEIAEGELFDEIKKNFEYSEEISNNSDELTSAKKAMRGTKIFVPDNLKADFNGQRKDGYGQFRKEHLGHFTLVNDAARGLGIDQFYQELNERYPNLFPDDIWNAADQLQQMAYVATAEADVEYRSGQYDDETIRDICNIIESGINKYSQGETLKQLDIDREKFYESAGVKQDIAPTFDTANKAQIPGQQTVFEDAQTTEEAPTKETPKEAQTEEPPKIAKVLTEEPKTDNKKRGIWSLIKNNVLDKGMIFEDISLKTGNRELQAKWNSIRYAKSKAQQLIGKGDGNVKSLNSIRETVEKSGKTQEFYDYLYHLHNVDRMSLEGNAQARIKELEGKFGSLMPEQIAAIALTKITDKTTEKTANTIREAQEWLDLMEVKNKPVFAEEVTADMSRATAAELEKANPEFKQWAQEVYDYANNLREMLVAEGVISRETADLWAETYPHYVPIRRAGKDGPAINVALDTNRTGINAPIKRATGGNSDILPLFDTMALRTEQTYRAIAKNRFGVELKNTLGTTIDRGNMSLDDAIDNLDNDEGLLKKGENGANPTFTVFENGERVEFEITEEMYDAIKPTGKGLSYTNKVANTAGNVFRGLLTEYNPVFMATNAVKDAQDVLINSQHAVQTYLNIPVAIKEMATKGHWYQEYIANGGEQNTYFDSDSKTFTETDKGIKKIVGMPLRAISAVNNTIERLPRLAEYIASRKSGASVDVSMLDAARVTTNFAAGGDLTKALNRNGFTFLNASTQGAIQQVRNVREAKANGLKGWLQLAGKTAIAGIPALILNGLLWDDDEEYEELSDYIKQNYYIVAKTEDGKFIRIPKGRTVAVIQYAFEQMENLITGDDEVDMQSFFELAISNLAPNNPLENNVIAPIMQVANNKTWYGEDLVPSRLQDMPEAEQYDETTDSISKWLGEKLDYSPYKINYLLNQYSGGIGDVALPYLTPESDGSGILAPFADKFTTDSTMKNQNVTDFYDAVDELTKNANSANATDEDILKDKYMNTVRSELSELYTRKREIQNSDLSDEKKDEAVREIQEQINAKAKEALETYGEVDVDDNYATVGDQHYRWYVPSKDSEEEPHWEKITDKQLEKQEKVTRGLGITPSEYWGNKEEYDFAYDSPGKYAVAKSVGGYSSYKSYSDALYDIKADKDEDGKSISGSRKDKVIDWINELDADYGEKIILFKSEYKADDTYNQDIIDYLNSRDDISYSEMESILKELGFTVDSEGYIYWD